MTTRLTYRKRDRGGYFVEASNRGTIGIVIEHRFVSHTFWNAYRNTDDARDQKPCASGERRQDAAARLLPRSERPS